MERDKTEAMRASEWQSLLLVFLWAFARFPSVFPVFLVRSQGGSERVCVSV